MTHPHPDQDLRTALDELSERATQGHWLFERMRGSSFAGLYSDDATGSVIARFNGFDYAPRPDDEADANGKLAAALVNAYRSGSVSTAPPRADHAGGVEDASETIARLEKELGVTGTANVFREALRLAKNASAHARAQAPDKAAEREELKVVADALAKADGWEDPDALWTDNVGVISRGGKGDPVWTQYAETAALVLAALAPKPTGTEAGRGHPVWGALDAFEEAVREEVREARQTAGIAENMAVRRRQTCRKHLGTLIAEILISGMRAATPTPPVSPTPDSTGPAGAEAVEAASAAFYDSMIGPEAQFWPHHDGWTAKSDAFKDRVRGRMKLALEAAALTPSAPIAAPVRDDGAREDAEATLAALLPGLSPEEHAKSLRSASSRALSQGASKRAERLLCKAEKIERAIGLLASLPTPASDVPGEAQTQEGGR